ncbi:60S ribosomal protein L4 [Cichlidogyrus casuarinus]|uniref:60S ribosomal protein L4 n=1 Tax=Cichlidogyrus casuarinus TaxID=1844966 RepID=A0ABD2Q7N8_9PLAT
MPEDLQRGIIDALAEVESMPGMDKAVRFCLAEKRFHPFFLAQKAVKQLKHLLDERFGRLWHAVARPVVNVYNLQGKATKESIRMPGVFNAPLRPDILNFVHDNLRKNSRQAYAVSGKAGHQTSAESWGTGRAVARIPRVRGGGTHRCGQGAFGNMCRGGHMFNPTKVWRKWHRRVNVQQRRYAMTTAIASTGVPALVMARGHQVNRVPELPLVVTDAIENFTKTKQACQVLHKLRAWNDIQKVYKSQRFRAGKGKMRNRKRIQKRGPIIIYRNDNGLTRAFRNIPGITLINVNKLNLLKLAPGGHMGRFAIWTNSAFKFLDKLYGTYKQESAIKNDYHLPDSKMKNADIERIFTSRRVRSVLHKANMFKAHMKKRPVRRNPLKHLNVLMKLNPNAKNEKHTRRAIQAMAIKKAEARKKTVKRNHLRPRKLKKAQAQAKSKK